MPGLAVQTALRPVKSEGNNKYGARACQDNPPWENAYLEPVYTGWRGASDAVKALSVNLRHTLTIGRILAAEFSERTEYVFIIATTRLATLE